MQYTEKAIKRSIEGGYKVDLITGDYDISPRDVKGGVWITNKKDGDGSFLYDRDLFLDPLFWKALGRSGGWNRYFRDREGRMWFDIDLVRNNFFQDEYLYRWHSFIDHLAEGKSPEEFFKALLK